MLAAVGLQALIATPLLAARPVAPVERDDAPPEAQAGAPMQQQAKDKAPDLLASARQMAGGADRELRRESGKQLSAGVEPRYAHLPTNLEAATVPKWTGIAKVTETTMPGTGERLYKISNGTGTYCIRIYSPNVGIDRYEWERKNYHPITCPR
jgi:hypothetical protein